MPRLFTGLEIPDDVANTLSLLRGGLVGARWITPDNYHITLRFMGDIDDDIANDIFDALQNTGRAPFAVTVEGLDVFGGDKPRALVARVEQTPQLMELQAEQERLMRRMGLPAETRKFTPHITLARLRETTPYHVANFLGLSSHLPPMRFIVSEFVVLSSRTSIGGGPYIIEAAYPLAHQTTYTPARQSA